MRLWRAITDTSIESPRSYILRTARNLALDVIRKNSKREDADTVVQGADEEFDFELQDTDPASRPDIAYLQKAQKEVVRQSINELPTSARELIILRDLEGLPYSEIAKVLGIPEGTLKSKLFRARERLRKTILSKNIF